MFDPYEFFIFASALVKQANAPESALRSAISRAYYANWLTAREKLFGPDGIYLTKPVRTRLIKRYRLQQSKMSGHNPGSHELIILAVSEQQLVLSQQLDMLKNARVHADYRLDPICLQQAKKTSWLHYAQDMLGLASQTIPAVQKLRNY